MNLAVIGAGSWGTALAVSLAERHHVRLWARDAAQCEQMRSTRVNSRYLDSYVIPAAVTIENSLAAALQGADLALIVTPVSGLRSILEFIAQAGDSVPALWACKGFEVGTSKLAHQVAAEALAGAVPCGVLSGPSFAAEVVRGLPVALTLASEDAAFASHAAALLHSSRIRIYSSSDVIGVEVGGAVKNVMAIASGISDGLGLGSNARAALITRGLAEITRLGLALGGRMETFLGLSGVGDLALTCTGELSRNRTVGFELARGESLGGVLAKLGSIAEGVYTAREVAHLAEKCGVEMPITAAVCKVLYHGISPQDAVEELMGREQKSE